MLSLLCTRTLHLTPCLLLPLFSPPFPRSRPRQSEKDMFASEIREYRDFLEQQRLMFLNVTDTVVLNQQQREIDQERKEEAIRQKASGRIEVRVCALGSCASVMQSKAKDQNHISE